MDKYELTALSKERNSKKGLIKTLDSIAPPKRTTPVDSSRVHTPPPYNEKNKKKICNNETSIGNETHFNQMSKPAIKKTTPRPSSKFLLQLEK